MERRRFLKILGGAAVGLVVPGLWIPKRKTFFLPLGKTWDDDALHVQAHIEALRAPDMDEEMYRIWQECTIWVDQQTWDTLFYREGTDAHV